MTIYEFGTDVVCELGISANYQSNDVILGDTFLRNFRTVLDYDKNSITLSGNPISHGSIARVHMAVGTILQITFGCIAVALLILLIVYCIAKKVRHAKSISSDIFAEDKAPLAEGLESNDNEEIRFLGEDKEGGEEETNIVTFN